ncbi:MAG: DUF2252 family protein [Myxococcales bacterium]|nr:DUF2252 family protein [Myxococcales bacterium]
MRVAALLTAFAAVTLGGCDDAADDARQAQIVGVLTRADEATTRSRPRLVAGKYARMAGSPSDFFRGSLPLYVHDLRSGTSLAASSRFGLDVPLVPSVGDPHAENFGLLLASDGSLALEPNDFDAADRAPYLWDVRRLTAGMALAAIRANDGDDAARAITAASRLVIARAAAEGYRAGIERRARGEAVPRVTSPGESTILADLFRRGARDAASRAELAELTELEGGARRLKRGGVDPDDPQSVYAELPAIAREALPAALESYRRTLERAPDAPFFQVLDAVRELGSGVASWPRVRVIVLVRGPSDAPDDDVLLELKELADSPIAGLYPPGVHHDDVGRRVLESSRAAWARSDAEPLWGVTTLLGLPCQVRHETAAHKSVRIQRMVEERGTPEALSALGRVLGETLARAHTAGPDGVTLARAVFARLAADPAGFVEEQARAGVAYAEGVVADHARFVRALYGLGPLLGVPSEPEDAPRPDLALLIGAPPPAPALPPAPASLPALPPVAP